MITDDQKETIVSLVKEKLGIRTNVRDTYITAIVDGVVTELEQEKGLVLDGANPYHYMFVVDFAEWRYSNKGVMEGMPRHLQFRLHNLLLSEGIENK